ncbi:MAG: FecR family protein, partial [Pseudomonadota bacterium]
MEIRAADGQRRSAALGMAVCAGETVVTGPTGRVELRLAAVETTLGLAPNAELRIPAGESEAERVSLIAGVLRFLSSVRDVFTVETRHATAGIDGTEAVIATAPEGTVIAVREGDVRMTPESGGVSRVLAAGTAGFTAAAGEVTVLGDSDARALPPLLRAVAVDVAGASDWAIYYPPILLAPDNAPQAIGDAARALDAGDPDAAERLLAAAGEAPEALALGAVIAIARGRTAEGAERAEQARAAAPDLAAAHLAVSYAAQAAGDIPGARAAAAVARGVSPDDPFAAARVAELSFIAGDAPRAERQAREALAVGESSLAQAILGLARLAASDYDSAESA